MTRSSVSVIGCLVCVSVTLMASYRCAQIVEQGRLFSGISRMVLDVEETYSCKVYFDGWIRQGMA